MLLKTKISTGFVVRLGLLGLFCLGFAGWFLFDGAVAYPRQRERALIYEELVEQKRVDEWNGIAKEHGWPLQPPGKPKEQADSYVQYGFAAFTAPWALLFLFLFLRSRKRWIELTETGMRTSWGQELEFDQIETLNKKKWKSKGIAKIRYRQDNRKRRLVLDDFKYEPDSTRAILREVESRLDVDQIVGGPLEPPEQEAEENPQEVDSGAAETQ